MHKSSHLAVLFLLALLNALNLVAARAETTHTVQPGETLSSIAARYIGNSAAFRELARVNNIPSPYRLSVGQKLRIPIPIPIPPTSRPESGSVMPLTPATLPIPTAPEETIDAQELSFIDVAGEVEVIRGGDAIRVDAGARARPGDSVRTGTFSRALLAGMGGERYIIGASTTILLTELNATYADRRVVARVDNGIFELMAPETPFLTRYLIETPTGSASFRFGRVRLEVTPPALTAISVFAGECLATVPRGGVTVPTDRGVLLNTTEPPPAPAPLPAPPGLSVETTAASAIVAAATQPGQRLEFELFRDPDLQRFVASRPTPTDAFGVGLARIELPPGRYWVLARAASRAGLSSPASTAGPVTITGIAGDRVGATSYRDIPPSPRTVAPAPR
jgi:LysM repeat protein